MIWKVVTCPVCGNEMNINLQFENHTCKHCRRKFTAKTRRVGSKMAIIVLETPGFVQLDRFKKH